MNRSIVIALLSLLPVGCSAHAQEPLDRLTIIAPAAPGGGWDQTARAMQRALESEGLVRVVQVENVPGAAGTVALAQFVTDPPRQEPTLLVTGLVMTGAIIFNNASVSLAQTTPIAALTGEYEVIVVPQASPLRSMHELMEQFRDNPSSVSWGGGSAGGTDHILAGLLADALGRDPALVNYIAFSGGGEAAAAVLGSQVTAAISGYSEFAPHIASGRLRALAISAPSAQPGIDARPLSDFGLDVALSNWRAVVAPPQISDAERQRLTDLVAAMVRSGSWQETLRARGWADQFLRNGELERFLDEERARVTRIARRLRTAAPSAAVSGRFVPTLVLLCALVVTVALVVEHAKSRSTLPFAAARAGTNHRSLAIAISALLLYLTALRTAGFVIASAMLFWMVTVAFGGSRLRDGVIAVLFAVGVYIVFTAGLDVSLPAGWLARWSP